MWIANAMAAGLVAWATQWPVIDLPYPDVPDEALEPCRGTTPPSPPPKPAPGKRAAAEAASVPRVASSGGEAALAQRRRDIPRNHG